MWTPILTCALAGVVTANMLTRTAEQSKKAVKIFFKRRLLLSQSNMGPASGPCPNNVARLPIVVNLAALGGATLARWAPAPSEPGGRATKQFTRRHEFQGWTESAVPAEAKSRRRARRNIGSPSATARAEDTPRGPCGRPRPRRAHRRSYRPSKRL